MAAIWSKAAVIWLAQGTIQAGRRDVSAGTDLSWTRPGPGQSIHAKTSLGKRIFATNSIPARSGQYAPGRVHAKPCDEDYHLLVTTFHQGHPSQARRAQQNKG